MSTPNDNTSILGAAIRKLRLQDKLDDMLRDIGGFILTGIKNPQKELKQAFNGFKFWSAELTTRVHNLEHAAEISKEEAKDYKAQCEASTARIEKLEGLVEALQKSQGAGKVNEG